MVPDRLWYRTDCVVRGCPQSTYIYRAPQCMSPRRNWDSPNPFAASECALPSPPDQRVGGAHPPAPKGVGEFQFRRWRKSLALCLLCGAVHSHVSARPWLPHRSSVISGELQAVGNSICLCLTEVLLWPPRRPPWTVDSLLTLHDLYPIDVSNLNFNILCLLLL
jgi:hypothetical protein